MALKNYRSLPVGLRNGDHLPVDPIQMSQWKKPLVNEISDLFDKGKRTRRLRTARQRKPSGLGKSSGCR
jgi:hypothetical protein